MEIIKRFLKKREFAKHHARANKIAPLIVPLLGVAGELALPKLRRDITSWNLSNETLLTYLGYVSGVIEAADKFLGNSNPSEWTAREIAFHLVIETQLDWIPGSEAFIELNRAGVEYGGTTIGALNEKVPFSVATLNGVIDFYTYIKSIRAGKPGFYHEELFKLGLIGANGDQ